MRIALAAALMAAAVAAAVAFAGGSQPANDWQPVHVMHARMAELRAIENGVALVRATGNGIMVAVDRLGPPVGGGARDQDEGPVRRRISR